MSIYENRIDPSDPLYYAPPHTRDRQEEDHLPRRTSPLTEFATERMPYDAFLEQAVAEALRHPLDPVFLDPPPDYEESRLEVLLSLTGRISAAVAVAACVVAFFAFVIPGSRNLPAAEQWLSSLVPWSTTQMVASDSKSAPAENAVVTRGSGPADVSPEQAEKLFQQFVQWQQKPPTASTSGQAK